MSQQATDAAHRLIASPAGRIHFVEQGSGPLVLLVHGFPESWYSWRRQLPVLAAAGYRAVAIDVRGYGRSSKPAGVDAYRMTELVEDNVAVVHALGEQSAVIVGHDWGATIAANSALVRPDVFRAVGLLRSNPMYVADSQVSTPPWTERPCPGPAPPIPTSSPAAERCATAFPPGPGLPGSASTTWTSTPESSNGPG